MAAGGHVLRSCRPSRCQGAETAGVSPDDIGLLIDTSVCRARSSRPRPSSCTTKLGLPPCLNFDLSNACLGFVNGMHLAGMMIDSVRSTTR